eukprot:15193433-Alexandrium_andersonii.AAC.1
MSASLVGSEMCIRDSPQCWRFLGSFGARSPLLPGPQGASPLVEEALMGTCLLYTSDAADDM